MKILNNQRQFLCSSLVLALLFTLSDVPPKAEAGFGGEVAVAVAVYHAVKFLRCMLCQETGQAIEMAILGPLISKCERHYAVRPRNLIDMLGRVILSEQVRASRMKPKFSLLRVIRDVARCVVPTINPFKIFFRCEIEKVKRLVREIRNLFSRSCPNGNANAIFARNTEEFLRIYRNKNAQIRYTRKRDPDQDYNLKVGAIGINVIIIHNPEPHVTAHRITNTTLLYSANVYPQKPVWVIAFPPVTLSVGIPPGQPAVYNQQPQLIFGDFIYIDTVLYIVIKGDVEPTVNDVITAKFDRANPGDMIIPSRIISRQLVTITFANDTSPSPQTARGYVDYGDDGDTVPTIEVDAVYDPDLDVSR